MPEQENGPESQETKKKIKIGEEFYSLDELDEQAKTMVTQLIGSASLIKTKEMELLLLQAGMASMNRALEQHVKKAK